MAGFHPLCCSAAGGRACEAQENQTSLVRPQKLADYPMPPADKPLIPLLRDFL
jgi:hypothetical protein